MHQNDDLPPEAFSWRQMTRQERHRWQWGPSRKKGFVKGDRKGGQESFINLFNRLVAEHGSAVADGMIEGGHTPFSVYSIQSLILDDLDLWFEATGRRSPFGEPERLALEAWLWETHDHGRQDGRFKPNKSPDHDKPWPKTAFNWAPRRWFLGIGPSSEPPLQMSIAGARAHETALALQTPEPSVSFGPRRPRTGYWKHVKGRAIIRGLAAHAPSADFTRDDFDRLAISAAAEAAA
jgi:hypothetical protein